MNASHPVESTERDVVLLFGTGVERGLLLAIKSLQATGSRARIIVFLPHELGERAAGTLAVDFGVEVVPWNDTELNGRKMVPHLLRYEVEQRWLSSHIREVDRVLHTDAYDAFFQGDPFGEDIIPGDRLLFAVEPHVFSQCGWNIGWLVDCYSHSMGLDHKFIICSGSIAGNASYYLQLIGLMREQREWTTCWDDSMDQPMLNVLVWGGKVAKAGIPFDFSGCDGGLLTLTWCVLEQRLRFNGHGQVVSEEGAVPPYVHQYDRLPAVAERLMRMCWL